MAYLSDRSISVRAVDVSFFESESTVEKFLMKQKEERFKCVALTTVGGWISMIVAFSKGCIWRAGENEHQRVKEICCCARGVETQTKSKKPQSFVERRQPIVLRGTAESLVQNLDIEDYVPFDEIVTVMELENSSFLVNCSRIL